ncbi:hypothetical protein DFH11DRAFT_783574 [Phellopilus nigrolimitatus]|nr:hypothetical protein DFH11DRAFT_783574 [Phellopilus nigrolimitatus]
MRPAPLLISSALLWLSRFFAGVCESLISFESLVLSMEQLSGDHSGTICVMQCRAHRPHLSSFSRDRRWKAQTSRPITAATFENVTKSRSNLNFGESTASISLAAVVFRGILTQSPLILPTIRSYFITGPCRVRATRAPLSRR